MLEYLHGQNIIYRDLKPENVLTKRNGYLKLIDFGTAKLLGEEEEKDGGERNFRTFTILGSPHYMAPEVIEGKGYSYAVDIYSLGVLFYEFIAGCLPFGQDLEDPYEIYKVRKSCDYLPFPSYVTSSKAKNLIRSFLSRKPNKRFPGWGVIKANRIFDKI